MLFKLPRSFTGGSISITFQFTADIMGRGHHIVRRGTQGAKSTDGRSPLPPPSPNRSLLSTQVCVPLPGEGSFVRSSVQGTNPGQTGSKEKPDVFFCISSTCWRGQVQSNKRRTSLLGIKAGEAHLVHSAFDLEQPLSFCAGVGRGWEVGSHRRQAGCSLSISPPASSWQVPPGLGDRKSVV